MTTFLTFMLVAIFCIVAALLWLVIYLKIVFDEFGEKVDIIRRFLPQVLESLANTLELNEKLANLIEKEREQQ